MSEVTICNMALSHLGDTAEVSSIKPPDGSVQAQFCARFYWMARNALLEMSDWSFAMRRVALAEVTNPTVNTWTDTDGSTETSSGTWAFAYATPADALCMVAVIPADAPDDYEAWMGPMRQDRFPSHLQGYLPVPGAPEYVPQPFSCETQKDGSQIVLTNVRNAILRYKALVEDTTQFSPLFTMALSYLLASMLAGPLIKGDAGIAAGEQMLQMFNVFKTHAVASDANHRKTQIEPAVSWIRGR
jgi:hypothetical protein